MTKVILLEKLKEFTNAVIGEIIMPVAMQENDEHPPAPRKAEVYCTRLPDSKSAKKKAPYILHQIITGKDVQPAGELEASSVTVRTVFCVYCDDEQEGGLMLLNLMERLRIALLEQVIVGGQFELDLQAGVESLVYPDDTAPYFDGEMISEWKLPGIKRKVRLL